MFVNILKVVIGVLVASFGIYQLAHLPPSTPESAPVTQS